MRAAPRSAAASLGLGFSSLASTVLIHVLKTHKLETKGVTREFYLYRIFPLGFLMARARAPVPRLSAQAPRLLVICGADAPRRTGGDAGLWKPGVPVPLGVVHSDPQGCDAGDDHGHPRGGAPGQAVHAGASLQAPRTLADADAHHRSLSPCPSSPSEPQSRRGESWRSPC